VGLAPASVGDGSPLVAVAVGSAAVGDGSAVVGSAVEEGSAVADG
jgi:hypothetical protein